MTWGLEKNLDAACLRPDVVMGTGQFQANAASNPVSSTFTGSLAGFFSVVHAGTGLYTITMNANFTVPADSNGNPKIVIQPSSSCHDATNTHRFYVVQLGSWSNTTKSFQVQCIQDSTGIAFDPPANADNKINFAIEIVDGTGK